MYENIKHLLPEFYEIARLNDNILKLRDHEECIDPTSQTYKTVQF